MTTPAPLKKDPMKAFRGIMAGTLILEVIVVALALPVIAKLHGGVTSAAGWVAFGFIAVFIAMCAFVRRPWAIGAVVGLHVLLIATWILLPAMGVIGVIFGLVWAYLLWLRKDLLKRMAEGRLPAQQQDSGPAASAS
jgi:Na+/melibiose symporter-like transporter